MWQPSYRMESYFKIYLQVKDRQTRCVFGGFGLKKVIYYLKPYMGKMLIGFIIKMLGTLMDLGLPWMLAFIIDDIIPLGKINLVLAWGSIMLVLSFGARIGNIIANRMASLVARNSVETIRHDLYEKTQHLSGTQLDEVTVPSLISRLTSDTYNLHQMIGMMQRIGVRAPIILIGGIIVTSTLELRLSLILMASLPILMLIVYLVSKKGIPMYTKQQEASDRMVRVVRENISGIRVIKALSKTDFEAERFARTNNEVVQHETKAGFVMALTNPLMNFVFNLGLTLVIIVGAYLVNDGITEAGKIVAFLSYFTIMLQAVMAITRIFVSFSKAYASAERISLVLELPEDLQIAYLSEDEVQKADLESSRNQETILPHIEFRQVSFAYTKEECLKDINFCILKGESLGIIGSTGSGKTTILNLLMRFYDVKKGDILIDGTNIKKFELDELRKRFGVVFQNDRLFADTVYENISFGRELSMEQVQRATKYAQATEFVQGLEKGFEQVLSIKGSNLSGGQKQRLLIARALAGNPEILVLDDSSSALDYKTDANLRNAIHEHYPDTTTILIAQRISSVMKCNHILVIEDGEMVGYGTHEELLSSCNVYQEIYESQMKN